jgi:peptide/nickel transport system substrate-binding protein
MKNRPSDASTHLHPDFPGLVHHLASGQISRRAFFRAAASLGFSAATAAALTATMTGGAALMAQRALADTPQKGGRLRIATVDSSPADRLDPATQDTFTDGIRSYIVFEKLTEIDPSGKVVPQLAESWSSDPTATVWTFELRKNVTFHNGKTLTADDVVYTFTRAINPDTHSQGAVFFKDLDNVKADGANRVVFPLKSPNAEFATLGSMRWLGILPTGAKDFPKDAIGTGPWKVKDFQPGLTTLYTRNENYWRNGLPYIDEIESTGIGDESARLDALLSGEVDMVESINPKAVGRVNQSDGAKALVVDGGAYTCFPMHSDQAPFNNLDVRQALKYSFDRKKFVDLAFDGLGAIGRDNPIPPSDPFFCKDVPIPTADPDKVKFHLKKAGAENYAFELHTSDANYGGANAAVVAVQLMRETGVNVTVKKDPADGYWSAVFMKVPWCTSSWTVRPTAITRIEGGYVTGAPYNEAFWSSPKVDQLVADAKKELDETKRAALLCEAQQIISAEGGTVLPVFVPWIDAYSTKVKNLKGHPMMFLGMGQWADVWLES